MIKLLCIKNNHLFIYTFLLETALKLTSEIASSGTGRISSAYLCTQSDGSCSRNEIYLCPSVRPLARPYIHPSIHPIPSHPSAHLSIHPPNHSFISIYLSIYLSIWYRNVLVPKRLCAESSWCRIVQGNFLGWCRNVLVPKRLGPNRLGAETTWCRNVCKSWDSSVCRLFGASRPLFF